MKATVEIPDALYQRVKSKSAMEQRTIREVTVALYRRWVESSLNSPDRAKKKASEPAWFGAARSYAEKVERHDMESVRSSIAKGRTA
jgi:hypothetical protein